MANFDGYDDIIDSREIIERIEELEAEFIDATDSDPAELMSEDDWAFGLGEEGAAELVALIALRDDADHLSDWHYGETLIHENYFTAAMKDDVIECGYLPNGLPRWIADNIDWDGVADNLKADYTDFTFRGQTYWARA